MSPETATPPEAGTDLETQQDRPEWLPSQFETPEMLAKSWKEAHRKITEMGQANSALRDENERLRGRAPGSSFRA